MYLHFWLIRWVLFQRRCVLCLISTCLFTYHFQRYLSTKMQCICALIQILVFFLYLWPDIYNRMGSLSICSYSILSARKTFYDLNYNIVYPLTGTTHHILNLHAEYVVVDIAIAERVIESFSFLLLSIRTFLLGFLKFVFLHSSIPLRYR